MALETPTGAEGPATDLLDGALRRAGYQIVRQPVSPGRDNLYAFREPPALVFSTHLDSVPPYIPLSEDAESLHGRGTCDAKGLAAAMVAAAERLAAGGERRIGLLFVVGEENGSDGARAAAAWSRGGASSINGEPTENRLSIGQKGSLRVDLKATGRAAHSAYPDEGESADRRPAGYHRANPAACPCRRDPLLGDIHAQRGAHRGRRRPQRHAARRQARRSSSARCEPTDAAQERHRGPAGAGRDCGFPGRASVYKGGATAQRVGDHGRELRQRPAVPRAWGERYQLGPGTIRVAHTDQEHIRKADLLRGVDLYVRLATDLLAREAA